jgi:hypothetical protein
VVGKIIVGNKCDIDLKRAVTYDEVKEKADKLGIPYFEIFQNNSEQLRNLFLAVIEEIFKKVLYRKRIYKLNFLGEVIKKDKRTFSNLFPSGLLDIIKESKANNEEYKLINKEEEK